MSRAAPAFSSLPPASAAVKIGQNAIFFVLRIQPTEAIGETPELLTNPRNRRFISAVVSIADPTIPPGRDPVVGCMDHPHVGIAPRWTNMMDGVKKRIMNMRGHAGRGPRKLILVQGPLVRARDKGLAQKFMGRLLRSDTVKEMLAMYQMGGDVLAVPFPRLGPNCYKEHHGMPEIRAFIMLVRKKRPISDVQLFCTQYKKYP